MANGTPKKKTTTRESEQLCVLISEAVVVLKRIASAIENHDEQNAPWYVLAKGGPKSGPLAKQPTVAAKEEEDGERDGVTRRVPSTNGYAAFVREVWRVLKDDAPCKHTDDVDLWKAIYRAGDNTLGVGWEDEIDEIDD